MPLAVVAAADEPLALLARLVVGLELQSRGIVEELDVQVEIAIGVGGVLARLLAELTNAPPVIGGVIRVARRIASVALAVPVCAFSGVFGLRRLIEGVV